MGNSSNFAPNCTKSERPCPVVTKCGPTVHIQTAVPVSVRDSNEVTVEKTAFYFCYSSGQIPKYLFSSRIVASICSDSLRRAGRFRFKAFECPVRKVVSVLGVQ